MMLYVAAFRLVSEKILISLRIIASYVNVIYYICLSTKINSYVVFDKKKYTNANYLIFSQIEHYKNSGFYKDLQKLNLPSTVTISVSYPFGA
jgi:hypothetical protein